MRYTYIVAFPASALVVVAAALMSWELALQVALAAILAALVGQLLSGQEEGKQL